jgi:hypothetical protein
MLISSLYLLTGVTLYVVRTVRHRIASRHA